ncbi:MAG: TM2 domain-containing protein [Alphaproteobacteria bacterium]
MTETRPAPAVRGDKSMLLAYVLWFFLGSFGVHRFYLGFRTSATIMLVLAVASLLLAVVLIGGFAGAVLAVWWLVDIFLIPGLVREANAAA